MIITIVAKWVLTLRDSINLWVDITLLDNWIMSVKC